MINFFCAKVYEFFKYVFQPIICLISSISPSIIISLANFSSSFIHMSLLCLMLATPERKKLSLVFRSVSICVSASTSISTLLSRYAGLAYVDWLLRINQRINLTHYYLCACSRRLFRCFLALHFENRNCFTNVTPHAPSTPPSSLYVCTVAGCRKINGAKMIQLREPRREKKFIWNENQRKTGNRWQLRRQILEARPEVAWEQFSDVFIGVACSWDPAQPLEKCNKRK